MLEPFDDIGQGRDWFRVRQQDGALTVAGEFHMLLKTGMRWDDWLGQRWPGTVRQARSDPEEILLLGDPWLECSAEVKALLQGKDAEKYTCPHCGHSLPAPL